MARLRALSLAASVILVLLCQSEAVRLAPAATTPGNATTSKPASTSTPKGKKFHFKIEVGSTWGDKGKVSMEDSIEFECGGVVYDKTLWLFNDEKAFKNCKYKEAKWLHKFKRVGEQWEYSVPYTSDDYLYIGPSPWLCKNLNLKFKIPVQAYIPGY